MISLISSEAGEYKHIPRGYACGGRKFLGCEPPDGDFGPATAASVLTFQSTRGLTPDGEIGSDTWSALLTA